VTVLAATLRRILADLAIDAPTHRVLAREYRESADAHDAVADAIERGPAFVEALRSAPDRADATPIPDTLPAPPPEPEP
jgi:hypothetical protein